VSETRYVPEAGDLIWTDFDPASVASRAAVARRWLFRLPISVA